MTIPFPKAGGGRLRRRLDHRIADALDEELTASPQQLLDEAIIREVRRHGPCSAAQLLAAVPARPSDVIERTCALVIRRVLEADPHEGSFAIRRRSR